WSAKNYMPALRFGLTRISSAIVLSGQQLLESIFFAQIVGFAGLGVYGRATGLAQIFCYKFAYLFLQAVYPVLTKIEQSTTDYNRASGLILRGIAWVAIPVAAIFAILADPVIRIVYGSPWLGVAPILPWAMASGAGSALAYSVYTLLLGNQQQRSCLLSDLCFLAGSAASLLWLLPMGTRSYLMGQTAVQLITTVLGLSLLHRARAITWKEAIGAFAWPLLATVSALLICEALRLSMGVNLTGFWWPLGYGAVFGVAYIGLLRFLFARQLGELVSQFPAGQRLTRLLALQARI